MTATLSSSSAYTAASSYSAATVNIVNTDDATITAQSVELIVGESGQTVPVSVLNHYGRPFSVQLSATSSDTQVDDPQVASIVTSAAGLGLLPVTSAASGLADVTFAAPAGATASAPTPATTFNIEQLGFGATDPSKFHPVASDPPAGEIFDTVQWEDLNHDGIAAPSAGEINGPGCYTRSGTDGHSVEMKIHVNIYAPGATPGHTYRIVATINAPGEGTFHFILAQGTLGTLHNGVTNVNDTVLTADLTAGSFIIPDVIAKKVYTIDYFVGVDGGQAVPAGSSTTTIYVINGNLPAAWTYNKAGATADTHPLVTVLDISCTAAAGQKANPGGDYNGITGAIWATFVKDRPMGVADASGHHMLYWGPIAAKDPPPLYISTSYGLIEHDDGRCGAWAGLMVDTLRAQGETGVDVYGITPKQAPAAQAALPPDSTHTTVFGFQVNSSSGQGVKGVKTYFRDHAVVQLSPNGPVYDPSYGVSYPSRQAWIDGSIKTISFVNSSETSQKETAHIPNAADCIFTPAGL